MKTLRFVFLLLSVVAILSCKKDSFDVKDPDVDQFVSIIKGGNYFNDVGYELPDFKMQHIERLLSYLNDTTKVQAFPSNPISSKYTNPKILNECLLWTIDGIRFGTKCPSLEPCLIDVSNYSKTTGYMRISGQKLIEISSWYINWYKEYKNNPTEALRKKNLLENTTYRWN